MALREEGTELCTSKVFYAIEHKVVLIGKGLAIN